MNENKNDLQEKINLIEKEIINRNLNKNLFLDYCSTKKNFGDDLSQWSLEELQSTINEYVQYHSDEIKNFNSENKNFNSENKNFNSENKINIENNKKLIENINNLQNIQIKNKEIKEIKCKKLEPSILSNKKIEIFIRNPKAIQTSLFKSNFISYEVYTKETNWLVNRRFSDFEWLRNILIKFYPRFFVPPLPNKKLFSRRFEVDFVDKRMKFLNKFINNLMLNETFKASDVVVDFLSISEHNQFEAKIYEYNSITPSIYVEDIKSLSGSVKILEDFGNEQFYENISNYFQIQKTLYERLNYNLKNFYYNFEAAGKNLEEIEKDFDTLNILNSRVMMKEEITKTFEELKIFFKNWRKIIINQNNLFKFYIKDFFKYQLKENSSFEELINSRKEIKFNYESNLQKLIKKKEKLWATNDISKWEIDDFNNNFNSNSNNFNSNSNDFNNNFNFNNNNNINQMLMFRDKNFAFSKMCTKETFLVENYHKQLNYANYMNNEELKWLINQNCVKFLDNIKEFTDKFYATLNDSLTVWSDLASYFSK